MSNIGATPIRHSCVSLWSWRQWGLLLPLLHHPWWSLLLLDTLHSIGGWKLSGGPAVLNEAKPPKPTITQERGVPLLSVDRPPVCRPYDKGLTVKWTIQCTPTLMAGLEYILQYMYIPQFSHHHSHDCLQGHPTSVHLRLLLTLPSVLWLKHEWYNPCIPPITPVCVPVTLRHSFNLATFAYLQLLCPIPFSWIHHFTQASLV